MIQHKSYGIEREVEGFSDLESEAIGTPLHHHIASHTLPLPLSCFVSQVVDQDKAAYEIVVAGALSCALSPLEEETQVQACRRS